jgi:hypothetical protein
MIRQRVFRFLAACFFVASSLLAQNYKIVNANSGKVLDVQNGATGLGALIQQWDWLGGANQQ